MVAVVGEVVGRAECQAGRASVRRLKAAHLGNCKHFSLTGTRIVGMMRDEAEEEIWSQAVQGSYFVLKLVRGCRGVACVE